MVGRWAQTDAHLQFILRERLGSPAPALRPRLIGKALQQVLRFQPGQQETISVYRRTSTPDQPGMVFIRRRSRGGSGPSVSDEHERLPDIDGEAFRETKAWRALVMQRHQQARYGVFEVG